MLEIAEPLAGDADNLNEHDDKDRKRSGRVEIGCRGGANEWEKTDLVEHEDEHEERDDERDERHAILPENRLDLTADARHDQLHERVAFGEIRNWVYARENTDGDQHDRHTDPGDDDSVRVHRV